MENQERANKGAKGVADLGLLIDDWEDARARGLRGESNQAILSLSRGNDSVSRLLRSSFWEARSMSRPTRLPCSSKSATTPATTSRDSTLGRFRKSMYSESV